MLLWISMYKFLYEYVFNLWCIHLGVEMLGQMITLCLPFREPLNFSKAAIPFYVIG